MAGEFIDLLAYIARSICASTNSEKVKERAALNENIDSDANSACQKSPKKKSNIERKIQYFRSNKLHKRTNTTVLRGIWIMPTKIVNLGDVEVTELPGRNMRLAVNKKMLGTEKFSGGVIYIEPRGIVKPCHAHLESEEIIFIMKGKGEVWIDNELSTIRNGDFVLFPVGSKHMLRNNGNQVMQVLFMFSPPTEPSKYVFYPEIKFPNLANENK